MAAQKNLWPAFLPYRKKGPHGNSAPWKESPVLQKLRGQDFHGRIPDHGSGSFGRCGAGRDMTLLSCDTRFKEYSQYGLALEW